MYKIIQTEHLHGRVEAHVDCFLLKNSSEDTLKYLSFFGSTASMKAITAQIFGGDGEIRIMEDDKYILGEDEKPLKISGGTNWLSVYTRNIKPGVTQKTIFSMDAFQPWKRESENQFLTYGANEETAKERAFQIVDKISKVPLSKSWTDWIWEMMTEDTAPSLPIIGGDVPEFNYSLLLTVPEDDFLEEKIKENLSFLRGV